MGLCEFMFYFLRLIVLIMFYNKLFIWGWKWDFKILMDAIKNFRKKYMLEGNNVIKLRTCG